MTKKLRERDWQELSAYLDGQLSSRAQTRLEKELASSDEMRAALEDLRLVRILLRSQPRLRAPRNFVLSPSLAGIPEKRPAARQLSPVFGLVSALASMLLILVMAGEFLLGGTPAAAPMQVELQAKSAEVEMAAAPTRIPSGEAPAMPAAQEQAPAVTDQRSMAPQPSQTALEAGTMEYPAPLASQSGIEAYPPPTESETNAQALQDTQLPAATEAPTQEALSVAQTESTSPEEPALNTFTSEEGGVQAQPPFWNSWRITQVSLLLLAIISGALALILRRSRA